MGGVGESEDWVWDSFIRDPYAGNSMLQTAENVAREMGIERAAQEETALLRYQQYEEALENNSAFHKRFMITPMEIKDSSGRKVIHTVTHDEGVVPVTVEGLSKLKPGVEGGTVTFGTQTHPADGNAGILLADSDRAAELSRNPEIKIRILSFGEARTRKGFMPLANIPASKQAMARAGITMKDLKAIKTHNPFAVNDVCFAWEMGINVSHMNRFGSSLVWGHPQAPTGARLIIELVEELVLEGGGYGLFTGCAAGDSAMAMVVRVD
jgi:acetyl-CoA acetyltransferase